MNKYIIKFQDGDDYKWVVVPERNTIQDIEQLFNQLSIEDFKDLLKEFIVNDNDGKPNVLDATGIVVKTNKDITEINWQLYSFE
tara:strand:- start:450 stop:701 length:252 start_codon:yes stop_codon:yes gene_type:complete